MVLSKQLPLLSNENIFTISNCNKIFMLGRRRSHVDAGDF